MHKVHLFLPNEFCNSEKACWSVQHISIGFLKICEITHTYIY